MQKKRVLYLDLIRIASALMVTSLHFSLIADNMGIDASVNFYQMFGYIGGGAIAVSCFFMVSGAALICRYRDNFSLMDFYKKRFWGLYPLFWLAYLFAFLDYFYRSKSMPGAPKINFLLSIIGMDGYFIEWIPTFYMIGEWFLGALIMCYLLFPIYRIVMCRCKYVLPAALFIASTVLIYHNPFPMAIDKNPKLYPTHSAFPYHNGSSEMGEVRAGKKADRHDRKTFLCLFLLHHVFLERYLQHFSGTAMNKSNTLLLFVSSIIYIYALAVGLDRIYAALMRSARKQQDIERS